MTTIDTSHGVVERSCQELFVHRNCLDRERFIKHLQRRPPYRSLQRCLEGHGDAFTLDDSTVAAGDAARLAREYGHEATIFLNGYNIDQAVPYFFSRLNVILDETPLENIHYRGHDCSLKGTEAKERFRSVVKGRLAVMGDEGERQAFVTEIGHLLGVHEIKVPSHLRPLSHAHITELLTLGVQIENHGWTHTRVGALSSSEYEKNIQRGRDWLQQTFRVEAGFFAVPNGDGLPAPGNSSRYKGWFLLDAPGPCGKIGPKLYNRKTLELPD